MLEYSHDSGPLQMLAVHYAGQVGDEDLVRFMSGQLDVQTKDLATRIVEGFWQMTDLAIDDHHQGNTVAGWRTSSSGCTRYSTRCTAI